LVINEGKFVVNWRHSLAILATSVGLFFGALLEAQDRPAGTDSQSTAGAAIKNVGAVKSINGKNLVLKTDAGPEITISVPDATRIVRLAAGQTDLKSAPAITFAEIQVGDRMLLRGRAGANGEIEATTIVVMKQADVAQKQQHDREDWQKRGAGGIVSAIDAASGTFTVSVTPTLSMVIKTSKDTSFLRYSPNSVKFADAQKGTIEQIKTGDQLRARGSRSADGKEIAAEEVISGTFRNIAGTISSIDAANNSITVKDILAKKSVVIKFNSDSQLRKLAPQMAQRLAFFLKGAQAAQGGAPGGEQISASGAPGAGRGSTGAGPGGRPAGGPDFQQMLNRIPSITLADLQKEEAVMVVATQGTTGNEVTAITLLGGVEPILTASPNGTSAAALFSGWNLGAPGGEGGGPQ
jgi:co-chaperonin GroES (HSP10)